MKFVLCSSEVKFAHHFAVRRNFTHEVNFTIRDNFTCPKGKLSWGTCFIAGAPRRKGATEMKPYLHTAI
ncbi:MAG: hypothetical protein IJE25_04640 [Clostridia bacterium]|nr:hypothetical protein [Clostridia bacterium]